MLTGSNALRSSGGGKLTLTLKRVERSVEIVSEMEFLRAWRAQDGKSATVLGGRDGACFKRLRSPTVFDDASGELRYKWPCRLLLPDP